MKVIVIKEVERLLFRPNIADRARYYGVTFLNQIILSKSDGECANYLIHLYFTLFEAMVKTLQDKPAAEPAKRDKSKGKPGMKGKGGKPKHGKGKESVDPSAGLIEIDSINSKMMAAILTGVNRAFPYANLDTKVFEAHTNTLFKISHLANFNTAIQALTLIFQVQNTREMLSDRFYRSLYESLFDRRLLDNSRQAMYLNLVYRALKADPAVERIRAFVKRIVQCIGIGQVPLICASLFLVSEVLRGKGLWSMVKVAEDEGEEVFRDVSDDEGVKTDERVVDEKNKYDARARDPLYTNAGKTCLWELYPFTNHFHPTVSLYARTLLSGTHIETPANATNYDPLLNHTMARFLDRFVYKAPKKAKTIYHGSSLMQPRAVAQTGNLLAGGRRKTNAVFEDEDGVTAALDDAPVNLSNWASRDLDSVPVDEMFYAKFFMDRKRVSKPVADDVSSVASSEGEMDEDEVWAAMQTSNGFDKAGLEEDEDVAFGDDVVDMEGGSDDSEGWSDVEGEGDEEDQEAMFRSMDGLGGDDEVEVEDVDDEEAEEEDEDDGDMDAWAAGPPAADSDDEEASMFASLMDGEASSDSESEETKKPKKKNKTARIAGKAASLGYSGDFFASKGNDFASAEDFEGMLDLDVGDGDEDEEVRVGKKRKSGDKSGKSKKARTKR